MIAHFIFCYLGTGFYGSRCPHLGVEATIKSLAHLLTHYDCSTVVGQKLQILMELLILEVGLSDQLFQIKFHDTQFLATDCWLKALWEKISLFNLNLTLGNISCRPPRLGDDWLMAQFTQVGYTTKELIHLNWVRLHQQVVFVSDVMDARGRVLDRKYNA